MAAAEKACDQDALDNAICSICLDYFKDPVIIPECGHSFCRACLDKYWGKWDLQVYCPFCRVTVKQRKVITNWSLASLVDAAKKLNVSELRTAKEVERLCDKHQEPQKLFCRDDKISICVVCDRSREHRSHEVIPLDEASDEYKDKLENCLEILRKGKEKIQASQAAAKKEGEGFLNQIKAEREKTLRTFRQLRRFIDEQENCLLAEMEEAMKEIERGSHTVKLEEQLKSLEGTTQEVEKKLKQPAIDMLQDIESFLERCHTKKSFVSSVSFPAALKWKIWDFSDINSFLQGVIKRFQDTFLSGIQQQKANIHLDPDTANPSLIVSEDCKSLRSTKTWRDVPDNPKRFDFCPFVLGREEFRSGRHFWEVTVGSEEQWALGVARKTLERKGKIILGPKGGIWCMGKWAEAYRNPGYVCNTALSLPDKPKKIRVTLNCEGSWVAFYDAERANLICELPMGSFITESVHPFFFSTTKCLLSLTS